MYRDRVELLVVAFDKAPCLAYFFHSDPFRGELGKLIDHAIGFN